MMRMVFFTFTTTDDGEKWRAHVPDDGIDGHGVTQSEAAVDLYEKNPGDYILYAVPPTNVDQGVGCYVWQWDSVHHKVHPVWVSRYFDSTDELSGSTDWERIMRILGRPWGSPPGEE